MNLTRTRTLREQQGLRLEVVAGRADLSVNSLRKIESGKGGARLGTAQKLADALGVTLDQLTGRAPLPAIPPTTSQKEAA